MNSNVHTILLAIGMLAVAPAFVALGYYHDETVALRTQLSAAETQMSLVEANADHRDHVADLIVRSACDPLRHAQLHEARRALAVCNVQSCDPSTWPAYQEPPIAFRYLQIRKAVAACWHDLDVAQGLPPSEASPVSIEHMLFASQTDLDECELDLDEALDR